MSFRTIKKCGEKKDHGVSMHSCAICGWCQQVPPAKRTVGDPPTLHSREAHPGTRLCLPRAGAPVSNLHKVLLWTSCEHVRIIAFNPQGILKGITAPLLQIRKQRLKEVT